MGAKSEVMEVRTKGASAQGGSGSGGAGGGSMQLSLTAVASLLTHHHAGHVVAILHRLLAVHLLLLLQPLATMELDDLLQLLRPHAIARHGDGRVHCEQMDDRLPSHRQRHSGVEEGLEGALRVHLLQRGGV